MQVQVHHVHAEIARPRHAGERVHVGPVHVEQGAARVEQFGGLGDARFERSQRGRVCHHQRRDVVGHQFLQALDVQLPARIRANVFDFVSGDDGCCRIGSVRRIGDQNLLARIAAAGQQRANQQKARELALGSGCGLERDGVHARDLEQALLQRRQDFQAALRQFLRLVGMFGGDAVHSRDKFVDPRVVLHGAGPQRIHAQVDGVVPGGKPREVADHFDLADFRKALDRVAHVVGAEQLRRIHRRDVERRQLNAALAGSRFLEDQALVLADVPPLPF